MRGFEPHHSPHFFYPKTGKRDVPCIYRWWKTTVWGYSQVVRQRTLTPLCDGPIPSTPARRAKAHAKSMCFFVLFEVVKDSVKGPASSRAIWSDTVQNGRPPEISKWSPLHTDIPPVPDHIYWYLPPLAVPVRQHLSSFLFL